MIPELFLLKRVFYSLVALRFRLSILIVEYGIVLLVGTERMKS